MSPLARAAISVAKQGSGGGRVLRGVGGFPMTPRQIADVWAQLPEESADACWARLALAAGVPAPTIAERVAMLTELRSMEAPTG